MTRRFPGAGQERSRQQGFTLIELMVVVAVLAILAALAGPGMGNLIATQRVRSAASDLHLAMVRTRTEAIKRNTSVTLSPLGGNWSTGWSIVDPENPGGPPLHTGSNPAGVSIATTIAQVVYGPSGRITAGITGSADGFLVTAASSSTARCVSADPSGRPYAKEAETC